MTARVLDWVTASLGVAGALLHACGYPFEGFCVWLPGNLVGIAFGVAIRRRGATAMYTAYLAITIRGLFYWRAP